MRTIEALLASAAIHHIGWTLLHSLWQSAAVALVLAVMLRGLRRATSESRYLVACVAQVMMVVLPAATSRPLSPAAERVGAVGTMAPAGSAGASDGMAKDVVTVGRQSAPRADWLPPSARPRSRSLVGGLVAAWMAGVTALTLRLLGGWFVVRRLARRGRPLAGPCDEALRRLARSLRVRRKVHLRESSLVTVPMVIGGLRPVVLLPIAVLTGLPPGQLEALLAHELAHIRRHDYLINLVQSAIEVLLFYHPAAWWASRVIRAEREHCCDDLAVSVCGDRLAYARALAAIEGLRHASYLSVAASDGPLLARVRRILNSEVPSMDRFPVFAPGAALLIGAFLLTAATAQVQQPGRPAQATPEVAAPDPDRVERPRGDRDPLIRTVYVAVFRSDSFPRYVPLYLTGAVIQEIEERTKRKVVGTPEEADAMLEGTVDVDDKDLVVENVLNLSRRFSTQVVASVRRVPHPRLGSERKEPPSTFRAQLTFNPEAGDTPKSALLSMCQSLATKMVKLIDGPDGSHPPAGLAPATLPLTAGGTRAIPIGDATTNTNEPRLKVEQTVTAGKVLKGQPIQFQIAISNTGMGPARNVSVQTKLSPGLRYKSGEPNDQNLFEQTLDRIEPGQQILLDPLVADTLTAGEQTGLVVAQSTDVTSGREDARSIARVTVIEPKLKLAITGDVKRFINTVATYNVTVENPGTATAHNVYVLATLPLIGRLVGPPPSGASWDASSGELVWRISQVEPGAETEKMQLSFKVRLGAVGFYQTTVEARADGGLFDTASSRTEVVGLGDIESEVVEQRRIIETNELNTFTIRVKNIGTKDVTKLLVRALLSKNLEPIETRNGTGERIQAQFNPAQQMLVFPPIDRLGSSKEVVLGIKVKASGKGLGTCRVFLIHDELDKGEHFENMAAFRITAPPEKR